MSILTVSEKRNISDDNSMTFKERQKDLEAQDIAQKKALQREKNSSFKRWSQYNLEHTKELMWLARKHGVALAMLYFLVDQMNDYNAVMCSYQVLQEVLEISKSSVIRNLNVLKTQGFIAILKSGTSNVYTVNDNVYWKSWGNKKKYSKFPANVILAATEQDVRLSINKHKEITLKE